jgi:hypothetical protein
VSAKVRAAWIVGTLGRDDEQPATTRTIRQTQAARPIERAG